MNDHLTKAEGALREARHELLHDHPHLARIGQLLDVAAAQALVSIAHSLDRAYPEPELTLEEPEPPAPESTVIITYDPSFRPDRKASSH